MYRALFDDLAFDVVDQLAEGDRASRFALTGSNRGRRLKLWGITVRRLHDGRLVEDYSAFDSLELFKKLGVWRSSPRRAAPRRAAAAARGSRRRAT